MAMRQPRSFTRATKPRVSSISWIAALSVISTIRRSEDDRAFVHTLIDLAHRLGLETVAEWVQDEQAASILTEWGCDFIQGRFVGLASEERPWATAEAKAVG